VAKRSVPQINGKLRPLILHWGTLCFAPATPHNASVTHLTHQSLAQLPVGSSGRVVKVAGGDEISVRLLEMGLTPGAQVLVVGTALLGDPIELELRGYRLSVRRSEAARVEIDS